MARCDSTLCLDTPRQIHRHYCFLIVWVSSSADAAGRGGIRGERWVVTTLRVGRLRRDAWRHHGMGLVGRCLITPSRLQWYTVSLPFGRVYAGGNITALRSPRSLGCLPPATSAASLARTNARKQHRACKTLATSRSHPSSCIHAHSPRPVQHSANMNSRGTYPIHAARFIAVRIMNHWSRKNVRARGWRMMS